MDKIVRETDADLWIEQIFAAKAVAEGGVIRRNRHWIAREVGRERFFREVAERGFHLLETGDQLVVICHQGRIYLHF